MTTVRVGEISRLNFSCDPLEGIAHQPKLNLKDAFHLSITVPPSAYRRPTYTLAAYALAGFGKA